MSEIERDRELEERLARAPREAAPARDLWPALVGAVGEERRGDPAPPAEVPRPEAARSAAQGGAMRRIPRLPLRIAASIALFAGGVVVGQRWEDPAPAPPPASASPLDAAAEVQRAGSEYISALSRLDESAGELEREQGVDAALSTLQGAAWELVRLRPEDPHAGRILYTVSEARTDGEPTVRF